MAYYCPWCERETAITTQDEKRGAPDAHGVASVISVTRCIHCNNQVKEIQAKGLDKPITRKKVKCHACGGNGFAGGDAACKIDCSECEGTGRVWGPEVKPEMAKEREIIEATQRVLAQEHDFTNPATMAKGPQVMISKPVISMPPGMTADDVAAAIAKAMGNIAKVVEDTVSAAIDERMPSARVSQVVFEDEEQAASRPPTLVEQARQRRRELRVEIAGKTRELRELEREDKELARVLGQRKPAPKRSNPKAAEAMAEAPAGLRTHVFPAPPVRDVSTKKPTR